ncbi:MAG: TspO/MBR family protein [Verrucomicrobiota bacterium]
MRFWKKAVLSILAIQVLGNASGLVTLISLDGWYDNLVRPAGTPPDGTFGPVWLVVYTLVGYALALLWDSPLDTPFKRPALRWFGIQFGFNLLWTPAFFGLQRIDLALVIIVPMFLSIAMTVRHALPVNRTAAFLMLPYLLWVGFATYLNVGFLLLN